MANDLYQRLREKGRLEPEDLRAALPGAGKGVTSIEDETQLAKALAAAAGCEYVDLANVEFQPDALSRVPAKVAQRTVSIPLRVDGADLIVAISDPLDFPSIDRVSRVSGMNARVVCATLEQVRRYIEKHYGSAEQADVDRYIRQSQRDLRSREKTGPRSRGLFFTEYEADLGSPPVEKLLDAIVAQAARKHATDIHITCHPDAVRMAFRVDGALREVCTIPRDIQASLLSRVKLTSGMDITLHRLPQEGNFEQEVDGDKVQLRASVFPTIQGEDIALRLQYRAMYRKDLSGLGFGAAKLRRFLSMLDSPKGMILVTGPVGVGKTTTLYSALARLSDRRRRIVTLEDPVESRIDHVAQSQVAPEQGYDFARGLKSILRMDPDVIMVGEIRDPETAQMALRASLTGMLVLSTLHTDRAAGAIPRLLDMDVEPYLLTSSLLGVLSQALVRTICPECKEQAKLVISAHDLEYLPSGLTNEALWRGAGCDRCDGTGYLGRTGIFELLVMDDDMRAKVKEKADLPEIHRLAREHGMETMIEDGVDKARGGQTTVEEVLRVARSR